MFKKQTDFDRNKVIKEYYNHLQPDMEYSDFEEICKTPFRHFKKVLSDDELLEFHFIYLGKFKVVPGYIINHLKNNERKFKANKTSIGLYEYYKNLYSNYIKRFPEKFKKHINTLKEWNYL